MSVLGFISGLVSPVTKLIDSMHTSEAEKLDAHRLLASLENEMASKVLAYETRLMELQAQTITAEAMGDSWLQRSWRPIIMLTFGWLVVADSYGWLPSPLADQAWGMLKIGIGGYIGARTADKVVPGVAKVVMKALKGGKE